jgi:hypothetical protein
MTCSAVALINKPSSLQPVSLELTGNGFDVEQQGSHGCVRAYATIA